MVLLGVFGDRHWFHQESRVVFGIELVWKCVKDEKERRITVSNTSEGKTRNSWRHKRNLNLVLDRDRDRALVRDLFSHVPRVSGRRSKEGKPQG